jgi:gamma-glutamylcyclotransferase (GGCT)/AIG2-like uncharacterized protein YtfP
MFKGQLVFGYGTLRRGKSNHHKLKSATIIADHARNLENYTTLDLTFLH